MCRILFCDWPTDIDQFDHTTFFELGDLSEYDLVFFDPLAFAVTNGFRQNENDLWVTEYTALSERKFMKLLASVKTSVERLKDFINQGGIWVIRANFPNSQIKVLKKSAIGNRVQYTESLTSPYFWLRDFVDHQTFHYGIDHSIRYLNTQHHIYRQFKNIPVKCLQTHDLTRKENVYTLADNGAYAHQPVISRVTYPPSDGEMYIIPYFLIQNEAEKLVETFGMIWHDKKYGSYQPSWLEPFEKRLHQVNPYTDQMLEIDHKITRLEQRRQTIEERQERIQQLVDLLYQEGEDLITAVSKALRILGFKMPDPPSAIEKAGFDFYLRGDSGVEIVGQISSSKEGIISLDEYNNLADKLQKCPRENKSKGLFIANAPLQVPPLKRPNPFCDDILHHNIVNEFCLMSTVKLFETACLVLENWNYSQIEAIKESIRNDILDCTGFYETNTRRYLAAATI